VIRFPGEEYVFNLIRHQDANLFRELILSQFYTGRHEWAINEFGRYISTCDRHDLITSLSFLLPYTEFSNNIVYRIPHPELNKYYFQDPFLCDIQQKRSIIFEEMFHLSNIFPEHFDRAVLKGFGSIVRLNSSERNLVIEAAYEIEGIFAIYKEDPFVVSIWNFASIIRSSLSCIEITSVEKFENEWAALKKAFEGLDSYNQLLPYILMLSSIADALGNPKFDHNRKMAEVSLLILSLKFGLEKISVKYSFGCEGIKHIVNHWEMLLFKQLRSDVAWVAS
jgi:hypothetical protein